MVKRYNKMEDRGSTGSRNSIGSILDEDITLLPPPKPSEAPTRRRLILGYLSFVLIGLAPQLIQNSLYSETALMKSILPEGKKISAFIVTSFMIANVFCIIYLTTRRYFNVSDKLLVVVILLGNLLLCPFIVLFWKESAIIGSLGRTSWVIVLSSFFAGAFGNTSTLVFFAWASKYHPIFTTAMSVGFGMSGAVSTFLSIVQDTQSRRFSFEVFFVVTFTLLFLSLVVFLVVLSSRFGSSLLAYKDEPIDDGEKSFSDYLTINNKNLDSPADVLPPVSKGKMISPVINMLWISIVTFFLPAIIPYLSSSDRDMLYMNSIFLIAPPLGAFVTGFFRIFHITWASLIETVLLVIVFIPVLKVTQTNLLSFEFWSMSIVLTLMGLISGYATTMVYLRIRRDFEGDLPSVERVSRWAAFANQIGAFLGILVSDILIKSDLYVKERSLS